MVSPKWEKYKQSLVTTNFHGVCEDLFVCFPRLPIFLPRPNSFCLSLQLPANSIFYLTAQIPLQKRKQASLSRPHTVFAFRQLHLKTISTMSFATPTKKVKSTYFFDSPAVSRPHVGTKTPTKSPHRPHPMHGTPRNIPPSPMFRAIQNQPTTSCVSLTSSTSTTGSSPLKFDVVASDWVGNGSTSNAKSIPGSPSHSRSGRTSAQADRFIPNRQSSFPIRSKLEKPSDIVSNPSSVSLGNPFGSVGADDLVASASSALGPQSTNIMNSAISPTSQAYQSSVAEACGISLNTRILEFQPAPPQSSKPIDLRSQYNKPIKAVNAQLRRKVPTTPERVLDAPGLIDDYYLNLLDWSSDNQVAIALERNVFIWNASTGSVSNLLEGPTSSYVSSIRWSGDGAYLSVGFSDGDIQIWDVEERSKLRSMRGHTGRVGVMSWDKHILSSGCRDGSIWNHDVRIAEHKVSEFNNHSAEVCGLEWRSDGQQLASGGNDNVVNIWDPRSTAPKFSKTNHHAAVRAIAWCPWQLNLLSTGGGSQDKYIHFWNSTTGARVNSIDTGSQVTSLKWSTTYKEIVSTHGYPDNVLTIWSYPSLTKNVDIVAHDARVLHSALSPDGQTLATCASDENLKFWKIFETVGRKPHNINTSTIASGKDVMMIR